MIDSLFTHRTPEAAARQLAIVLAWTAEQELETLEEMESRSSTPKSALARQRARCDTVVRHCHELGVGTSGLRGDTCTRLASRLAAEPKLSPPKIRPTPGERGTRWVSKGDTEFNVVLAETRVAREYSKAELASKTGFTPSFIDYYERVAKNPSVRTLVRFSEALMIKFTITSQGMSVVDGRTDTALLTNWMP